MDTIVVYTDRKPPENLYPERIVSPLRSSPCCFSSMEEVGSPQAGDHWIFQYKRCRRCGYTVRLIVREIPDAKLAAGLRRILELSFVRNAPG